MQDSGTDRDEELAGGCLVLLGGGEFSFGETLDADRAWLARTPPGPIGFVPVASGSTDYPRYFGVYLAETFEREVEVVPVFRERDAKRGRNCDRIREAAAVYLGGGVADHLLDAIAGSPVHEALFEKLAAGGVVVAIAAAAQACGAAVRSVSGAGVLPGLSLAPGLAVETNFDPGHDRRLRQLMSQPGVDRGVGIPAGAALLIGQDGVFEPVGAVFALDGADGDLVPLAGGKAAEEG